MEMQRFFNYRSNTGELVIQTNNFKVVRGVYMCFTEDFMQAAKDFAEFELATDPFDALDDEDEEADENEDNDDDDD